MNNTTIHGGPCGGRPVQSPDRDLLRVSQRPTSVGLKLPLGLVPAGTDQRDTWKLQSNQSRALTTVSGVGVVIFAHENRLLELLKLLVLGQSIPLAGQEGRNDLLLLDPQNGHCPP
jgi:hypothetical protein